MSHELSLPLSGGLDGWDPAAMLAAVMSRDPACDGRFLFGVVSTGIYCLPSCKARNPKPENVRFFPDEATAQEAGLRPCKRCRPDDFYGRRDPDREALEAAVSALRRAPGDFPAVGELAGAAGMGASKLHALVRHHYHTTPGRLLTEARLERAGELLLASDLAVTEVAFEVGYESLSAFNDNFLHWAWLSPSAYRRLRGARSFTLRLPAAFPQAATLARLGRDPQSLTEAVRGRTYRAGALLAGEPCWIAAELAAEEARVEIGGPRLVESAAVEAHARLLRRLGLCSEPAAFAAQVRADPTLAPLLAGRRALRIQLTADPFDCLLWAIVGQQVNLAFAFTLMRRVVELAGERVSDGLWAPPRPAAVAAISPRELLRGQFSRSKADYLLGAAAKVASGELALQALARGPATVAEEELLAIRGLGPWTVGYLLMLGLGFADAVPWGDAGLLRGLQRFFGLPERPDRRRSEQLLEPFRPYRSYATLHLWQFLEDAP